MLAGAPSLRGTRKVKVVLRSRKSESDYCKSGTLVGTPALRGTGKVKVDLWNWKSDYCKSGTLVGTPSLRGTGKVKVVLWNWKSESEYCRSDTLCIRLGIQVKVILITK